VVSKSSSVKSNFQVKEAKPKADWEDFKDVPSTSRTFAQPRASVQHNIKHQAVAKIDQPTSSKDKLSSGVAVKPDNPILMRPSTSAVVPPKLVQPMPAVERQSFLMPPVPPKVVAKPVAKLEPKKPELTNWQAPTSSKRSLQIDKFQDTANSSMLSFASEVNKILNLIKLKANGIFCRCRHLLKTSSLLFLLNRYNKLLSWLLV